MSGTFDFATLHVLLGTHRVTGRAKGDSVSVVYENDQFVMVTGVDGNGYFVKIEDRSATVTLTLGLESITNLVFSTLFNADVLTPGGIMVPLAINDAAGSSKFFTDRCRIVKMADGVWSDGGSNRTWTIKTTNLQGVIGGLTETAIAPAALLAA